MAKFGVLVLYSESRARQKRQAQAGGLPFAAKFKATIRLRSSRRVDRLPVCAFHPGGGKKARRRHRVLGTRDMLMASTAASIGETGDIEARRG